MIPLIQNQFLPHQPYPLLLMLWNYIPTFINTKISCLRKNWGKIVYLTTWKDDASVDKDAMGLVEASHFHWLDLVGMVFVFLGKLTGRVALAHGLNNDLSLELRDEFVYILVSWWQLFMGLYQTWVLSWILRVLHPLQCD